MSQHFNEAANFPAERITDELIAALAYDDYYAPDFDENFDDDDDSDLLNSVYAAPCGRRAWLNVD